MKRLLALLLAISLLMLPACQNAAPDRLSIVTSVYPIYCMALNLTRGAQGVTVRSLSNATSGCAHDYQLTSADRRSLADADVVVINGAGLEPYLDALLPTLKNVADSSEGIELIASSDAHDAAGLNPHTWVSIERAIIQLRNIKEALVTADSKNADVYEKNCLDYTAKLQAEYKNIKAALAPYAGTQIVTFHPAFDYFAQDMGLVVAGSLVIEPEAPPTARELRELIAEIESSGAKAMFVELGDIPDSAATVARDTGISVYALDPAAVPLEGVADIDRYVYAMEYNLGVLQSALDGD